jgi:hypothetical protein
MRDSLFRGAHDNLFAWFKTQVKTQIEPALNKLDESVFSSNTLLEPILMGEFNSLDECVEKVKEDIYKNKCPCLITGSLNYLTNWLDAKDIDVMVFCLSDKNYSQLIEHGFYEIMMVFVKDDKIVRKRLGKIYPVSRLFFLQRNEPEIVQKIIEVNDECKRLNIKSSIVPAFKGFVISTVAIKTNGTTPECLKNLARLKLLNFDENGDVEIEYYDKNTNVLQMTQHQLCTPHNSVHYLGSAPLRRGITKFIEKYARIFYLIRIKSIKDTVPIPSHMTENNTKMQYAQSLLSLYNDEIIFVLVKNQNFEIYIEKSEETANSTYHTETISFWKVRIVENATRSTASSSEGIANSERPTVPKLVVDANGESVSDEIYSFVHAMKRRYDKGEPLISRYVEDDSIWPHTGLCLCHTNAVLPNSLTLDLSGKKYMLEKWNEGAYHMHMNNWFQCTHISFNDGYTRFANVIKLIDGYSKNIQKRNDLYEYDIQGESYVKLLFDDDSLRLLGPEDNEIWSVKRVRNAWPKITQKFNKKSTTNRTSSTLSPTRTRPSIPDTPPPLQR